MSVSTTGLPACVAAYLTKPVGELASITDSVFASDAIVRDEGRTYAGADSVRGWLAAVAAQFTMKGTVRGVTTRPDTVLARVTYHGDFPGSPVDRHLHFSTADSRITALTICP
ncbi:nuclear transport factor 2 family protein [Streptomyces sp. NPDC087659]|uniref:nuclear transport factor 2 family protein n=1 Tax=Streptomyces sp. NPDC087659 TaxID=3365801 RepID=UPI0037F87B1D